MGGPPSRTINRRPPPPSFAHLWSCLLSSLPLLSPSACGSHCLELHTGSEFSTIRTPSCCWDSGLANLLPQPWLDQRPEVITNTVCVRNSDVRHLWHYQLSWEPRHRAEDIVIAQRTSSSLGGRRRSTTTPTTFRGTLTAVGLRGYVTETISVTALPHR